MYISPRAHLSTNGLFLVIRTCDLFPFHFLRSIPCFPNWDKWLFDGFLKSHWMVISELALKKKWTLQKCQKILATPDPIILPKIFYSFLHFKLITVNLKEQIINRMWSKFILSFFLSKFKKSAWSIILMMWFRSSKRKLIPFDPQDMFMSCYSFCSPSLLLLFSHSIIIKVSILLCYLLSSFSCLFRSPSINCKPVQSWNT